MMNIILVAGGLNTRFNDISIFPKILLPYFGNDSILTYNTKLFEKHNIFLIINKLYYNMTLQYINTNKLNVKLVTTDNSNGSYNTIASVKEKLPKDDLFFIWSDLILPYVPQMPDVHSKYTIYTYNGEYRFIANEKGLRNVNDLSGNVPGIYYLKSKHLLGKVRTKEIDLVEFIGEHNFDIIPYNHQIIEFRDLNVYKEFIKSQNNNIVPRYFNKIEIDKEKMVFQKTSIDPSYDHLIEKEIEWYKTVPSFVSPSLLNYIHNTYSTQYLDGYETLDSYIRRTQDFSIIDKELELLDYLHGISSKEVSDEKISYDFRYEFIDKIKKRNNSINKILILSYPDFDGLLERAYTYICENISHEYSLIHGDVNGSNCMVHPETKDIKLVDPRGYFGGTKLYGPKEYDYAKVAYFLSGYDHFNTSHYLYSLGGYDVPQQIYKHPKLDTKLIRVLVGVIWVALAGYISNNVFKVNIAYQHGIEIIKKELKEE